MNSMIKLSLKQLTTEDLRPGHRLRTIPCEERIRQIAKSIALAGVVSMAATAGPAVAASFVPVGLSFTIGGPICREPTKFPAGRRVHCSSTSASPTR